MSNHFDFEALTPDLILSSVEAALDVRLSGLTSPHHSYINRVFELEDLSRRRLIAKFYRPGRWSEAAIREEHQFVLDCEDAEIPVVAPLDLQDDDTVGNADGIFFAVFPKRHGRIFEFISDEDWRRFGRLLGRLHNVGEEYPADHRVMLHPTESTEADIQELLDSHAVPGHLETAFADVADAILDVIVPMFDDTELIRIHGDCHSGNIIENADDGIMLIDFDDMAVGPPAQDLWMLLPGSAAAAQREIKLILEGYEDFRPFDSWSLRLIEPLRAMRLLYFTAWRSRQIQDPRFRENFPDWGDANFWENEIAELQKQLSLILEARQPDRWPA